MLGNCFPRFFLFFCFMCFANCFININFSFYVTWLYANMFGESINKLNWIEIQGPETSLPGPWINETIPSWIIVLPQSVHDYPNYIFQQWKFFSITTFFKKILLKNDFQYSRMYWLTRSEIQHACLFFVNR